MARERDETALLAAIRAAPDDDTVRLVYADWIDEHRDAERDRATSEYIRLACGEAPRGRANAWLRDNWQRLSPTLAAGILYPARQRGGRNVWVVGSVVDLYYDPPYIPDFERLSGIRLQLHFARGFCVRVRWLVRARNPDPFHVAALAGLVRVLVGTDHRFVEYDDP